MSGIVFYSALLGIGALVGMRAIGTRRSSLSRQFAALRPARTDAIATNSPPPAVFSSELMERRVRPSLEFVGARAVAVTTRAGLGASRTRQRLAASGDRHGIGLFWGQKIACAVLCVCVPPLAASFGAAPQTPVGLWITLGALGFVLPDIALRSKAAKCQQRMKQELVRFAELLSLGVSAGLGVESAIEEATATETGRLFSEIRAATRQGAMAHKSLPESLAPLPTQLGVPELEPLVAAITAAATQGIALSGALSAQVRSLRDRRRIELITTGERAQVRMLIPVGGLILPAFLLVVLYPAAVQLLQLGGQ